MYAFLRYNILLVRSLAFFITFSIIANLGTPIPQAQAQSVFNLPASGSMLVPSPGYTPVMVQGVTIHPENPLQFDFIIDTGSDLPEGEELEEETKTLIKYFLAALTIPEDQMWVNLSPYEKDRIIPAGFGDTEMGRDLLAQDYILKQFTASLMYPEDELGQEFWDRVYRKAVQKYGTTEIPLNTFNKVWIVPKDATVYEHGVSAFVIKNHLKVMLEEDYLAMNEHEARDMSSVDGDAQKSEITQLSLQIVREILIPEIEKEVNEGKIFAKLRQMYQSMILATWYKQNMKESLLGQIYVNQEKTLGVDTKDKEVTQKIYDQYVEAFNKGVYDYIREDWDPLEEQVIPRRYFSGGAIFGEMPGQVQENTWIAPLTPAQYLTASTVVNQTIGRKKRARWAAEQLKALQNADQIARYYAKEENQWSPDGPVAVSEGSQIVFNDNFMSQEKKDSHLPAIPENILPIFAGDKGSLSRDAPPLTVHVKRANKQDSILGYLETNLFDGGKFSSAEKFEEYLETLKDHPNDTLDVLVQRFLDSEYGLRIRRALAKENVQTIVLDLLSKTLFDNYYVGMAAKNIINHKGTLYISTEMERGEIGWILSFLHYIWEAGWGHDAMVSEGIIFEDREALVPTLIEPRVPSYFALLELLKVNKFVGATLLDFIAQNTYKYLDQLKTMSNEHIVSILWDDLESKRGEPVMTSLYNRQTRQYVDVQIQLIAPNFQLLSGEVSAYANQIKEAGGLRLEYSLDDGEPFFVIDVSQLFAEQITGLLEKDDDVDLRESIDLIRAKAGSLASRINRLLRDLAEQDFIEFRDNVVVIPKEVDSSRKGRPDGFMSNNIADQDMFNQFDYSLPVNSWKMSGEEVLAYAKATIEDVWNKQKGNGGEYEEALDEYFQIIMGSEEFRRVAFVSQGLLSASVETEKKMHHLIELMHVVTDGANQLGLNTKLAIIMVLLHDLGHSVFGHLGEKSNRYATTDVFKHKYKHAFQGVKIMKKLLFANKENTHLSKILGPAIVNHGRKDLRVDVAREGKPFGSAEGVLLMLSDESSRIGTDLRLGIHYGFFTIQDVLNEFPELNDHIGEVKSTDSLGDQVVALLLNDIVSSSDSKELGFSSSVGALKERLTRYIDDKFIKKLREENHYPEWANSLAKVLEGRNVKDQVEFLRTKTDREVIEIFQDREISVPVSTFLHQQPDGFMLRNEQLIIQAPIMKAADKIIQDTTNDLIKFTYRFGGTRSNRAAAKYLFESLGYAGEYVPTEGAIQQASDPSVFYRKSTDRNVAYVAAVIPGTKGAKAKNIILTAHFDAVSKEGADDNASGVSFVMAMAKILREFSFQENIYFVFTNDEEHRKLGARVLVKDFQDVGATESNTLFLNFDSIGQTHLAIKKEYAVPREPKVVFHFPNYVRDHGFESSQWQENIIDQLKENGFNYPNFFFDLSSWSYVDKHAKGELIAVDGDLFEVVYGYSALTVMGLTGDEFKQAEVINTDDDTVAKVSFDHIQQIAQWFLASLGQFFGYEGKEILSRNVSFYPMGLALSDDEGSDDIVRPQLSKFLKSAGIRLAVLEGRSIDREESETLQRWMRFLKQKFPGYNKYLNIIKYTFPMRMGMGYVPGVAGVSSTIDMGYPLSSLAIGQLSGYHNEYGSWFVSPEFLMTRELAKGLYTSFAKHIVGNVDFKDLGVENVEHIFINDFAHWLLYGNLDATPDKYRDVKTQHHFVDVTSFKEERLRIVKQIADQLHIVSDVTYDQNPMKIYESLPKISDGFMAANHQSLVSFESGLGVLGRAYGVEFDVPQSARQSGFWKYDMTFKNEIQKKNFQNHFGVRVVGNQIGIVFNDDQPLMLLSEGLTWNQVPTPIYEDYLNILIDVVGEGREKNAANRQQVHQMMQTQFPYARYVVEIDVLPVLQESDLKLLSDAKYWLKGAYSKNNTASIIPVQAEKPFNVQFWEHEELSQRLLLDNKLYSPSRISSFIYKKGINPRKDGRYRIIGSATAEDALLLAHRAKQKGLKVRVHASEIDSMAYPYMKHTVDNSEYADNIDISEGDLFGEEDMEGGEPILYQSIMMNLLQEVLPGEVDKIISTSHDVDMVLMKRLFQEASDYLVEGGTLEVTHVESARFLLALYEAGWQVAGKKLTREARINYGMNRRQEDYVSFVLVRQSDKAEHQEEIRVLKEDLRLLEDIELRVRKGGHVTDDDRNVLQEMRKRNQNQENFSQSLIYSRVYFMESLFESHFPVLDLIVDPRYVDLFDKDDLPASRIAQRLNVGEAKHHEDILPSTVNFILNGLMVNFENKYRDAVERALFTLQKVGDSVDLTLEDYEAMFLLRSEPTRVTEKNQVRVILTAENEYTVIRTGTVTSPQGHFFDRSVQEIMDFSLIKTDQFMGSNEVQSFDLTSSFKESPLGGIDLNPALLNLEIKRDGQGVPLPMPMQNIDDLMNVQGFIPILINISPINTVPLLLGFAGSTEDEETEFTQYPAQRAIMPNKKALLQVKEQVSFFN